MSNSRKPKLVVLISGTGRNLQAIIDGIESGAIDAELAAVISNVASVQGLDRARKARVPAVTLSHRDFADRASFDSALADKIEEYQPDIVPLAGFMRVLGEPIVQQFHGRMINIHPSLLPLYRGLHTHRRALESGDDWHGASVHFVTAELDGGPVIMQGKVPIQAGDNEDDLATRVMSEVELAIYPQVVSWLASGDLRLDGDQVMFRDQRLTQPLTLGDLPK